MAHVFISYVHDDQKLVDRLTLELKHAGIGVWVDREQLKPGKRWKSVIPKAIEEGTHFLACFSKAYQKRDRSQMNKELLLAIEELQSRHRDRAWFLPVRLDDCEIPALPIGDRETLRDIQWADLHGDWRGGLRDLMAELGPHYTTPEQREAAERHAPLKAQLSDDKRLVKALLDIRSKDDFTKREAARELWQLRDAETIPTIVAAMSEEIVPTLTKITLMNALREFGPDAVPCLIDQVRHHARLVSEVELFSEHAEHDDRAAWRAAVLHSDAGRLLVRIGAASIPSLQKLRDNEEWLGEAADALLAAIEERQ